MAEEMKETAGAAQSQAMELSDFEKLLNDEFKPKSEEASQAVQGAVKPCFHRLWKTWLLSKTILLLLLRV